MVAPEMEKLAEKYEGAVDVVKVDVDANPRISQAFNIMSIPTIAYFKPGSQPQGVVGFRPLEQLEQQFNLTEFATATPTDKSSALAQRPRSMRPGSFHVARPSRPHCPYPAEQDRGQPIPRKAAKPPSRFDPRPRREVDRSGRRPASERRQPPGDDPASTQHYELTRSMDERVAVGFDQLIAVLAEELDDPRRCHRLEHTVRMTLRRPTASRGGS